MYTLRTYSWNNIISEIAIAVDFSFPTWYSNMSLIYSHIDRFRWFWMLLLINLRCWRIIKYLMISESFFRSCNITCPRRKFISIVIMLFNCYLKKIIWYLKMNLKKKRKINKKEKNITTKEKLLKLSKC